MELAIISVLQWATGWVAQGAPSGEIPRELHESLASSQSPFHNLPHLLEISTSSPMWSSWFIDHNRLTKKPHDSYWLKWPSTPSTQLHSPSQLKGWGQAWENPKAIFKVNILDISERKNNFTGNWHGKGIRGLHLFFISSPLKLTSVMSLCFCKSFSRSCKGWNKVFWSSGNQWTSVSQILWIGYCWKKTGVLIRQDLLGNS